MPQAISGKPWRRERRQEKEWQAGQEIIVDGSGGTIQQKHMQALVAQATDEACIPK
jgi:hypothetical protein